MAIGGHDENRTASRLPIQSLTSASSHPTLRIPIRWRLGKRLDQTTDVLVKGVLLGIKDAADRARAFRISSTDVRQRDPDAHPLHRLERSPHARVVNDLAVFDAKDAGGLVKLIPGYGNVISGAVAAIGTQALGEGAIAYFIERKTIDEAKQTIRSASKGS